MKHRETSPWLRVLGLSLLLFALVGCGADSENAATSESDATGVAGDAEGHVVATFLVPGIDDARAKSIAAALSENPGLLSAQAVPDSGLFRVAFSTAKTSPAEVLAAVSATGPDVALRNIVQAAGKAGGDACAGCPAQASCGGSH